MQNHGPGLGANGSYGAAASARSFGSGSVVFLLLATALVWLARPETAPAAPSVAS